MSKIFALLMIKNESATIRYSLKSLNNKVDNVYIYDTGSTDDTIKICKEFENVVIAHGPWVNFEVSRNAALEWVESQVPSHSWVLLMDSNDELRGDLRKALSSREADKVACGVQQLWESTSSTSINKVLRIIKTGEGWRYKYPVHEFLYIQGNASPRCSFAQDICLFQNRKRDIGKTLSRNDWDIAVLKSEIEKYPADTRLVFYLANTYFNKKMWEFAKKMYEKRISMQGVNDDTETKWECYKAMLRCGHVHAIGLQDASNAVAYFIQASSYSEKCGEFLVDGLIEAGRIYRQIGHFKLAYMCLDYSTQYSPPENHPTGIDLTLFHFTRWNELAFTAWQLGKIKEGKQACKKAMNSEYGEPDVARCNMDWIEKSQTSELGS